VSKEEPSKALKQRVVRKPAKRGKISPVAIKRAVKKVTEERKNK